MAKELGFRISVEGTDSQIRQLGELRDSTIRLGEERKKLEKQAKTTQGLTKKQTKALGDYTQKIKENNAETAKLNNKIKATNKELKSSVGSYDKLTSENARLTASIRKLSDPLGKNIKKFTELSNKVKANTAQLTTMDKAMGRSFRNVGNYTAGIKEGVKGMGLFSRETQILTTIQSSLKQITASSTLQQQRYTAAQASGSKATKLLAVAQKFLNKAMKASPIFILIGALTALGSFFTRTQRGADKLGQGMAGLTAAFDVVADRAASMGEGISDILSGNFSKGFDLLKNSLDGVGKEIAEETALAVELKKALQDLNVQIVNDEIKTAKIRQDIQKLRLEVEEKDKFSIDERIAKNREAFALEEKITKIQEKNLIARANQILQNSDEAVTKARLNSVIEDGIELTVKELGQSESKVEDLKELGELTKQFVELKGQQFKKQKALAAREQSLVAEQLAFEKKANKERQHDVENINSTIASDSESAEDIHQKNLSKIILTESEKRLILLDELEGEYADKKIAKEEAAAKKEQDDLKDLKQRIKEIAVQTAIDSAQAVSDAIFDSKAEQFEKDQEQELEQIEIAKESRLTQIQDEADTENLILQSKLDKGLITEQQFEQQKDDVDKNKRKQKEKAEQAAAAKKLELDKKAFENKKRLDTIQALINGALAVTQALASNAPPLSYVLAAASAVATGVQIGIIRSQKFAKGGVIEGNSHANGGVPFSVGGQSGFEAEGGEVIINKKSAAMFRDQLSDINAAGGGVKFARGGLVKAPTPRQSTPTTLSAESIATQVAAISSTIKVENVATETADVNSNVLSVENLASA